MMKYVLSGLCILLMSPQNVKTKEVRHIPVKILNRNNQQQQPVDTTPQILQQFGGVVVSFLNLLRDPENPDHAFAQVGNMVQGMVNIGVLATKRYNKEQLKRKLKEFFESQEGKLFIEYWQDLLNTHIQKS